ncbi:ATP-binding protein [Thiohalorhabdus sp. Cl-TMA]|uniref:histidine kinase n=1 Tax=Thiohalorhabdus methylotrophus TaxID=3242694 RepID=A0ABV4TU11_9GAMM
MRLLPVGARGVIALGLMVALMGALQARWPVIALGLGGMVLGGMIGWAWARTRLFALRRWLRSREGVVALQGAHAWDTLESELRYYFKHRDRQIRETRRRLSQLEGLAQELPVGVALLDIRGRLMEANGKAFELLALDPERGHGQRLQGWLREPSLQHLFSDDGEALRHGTAPYHPDPSRTLSFTVTHKEDGTFLLVVEEITERLRLHQMREDFVANVSHELKSPLTSLRGFAETLLGDPDLERERRQEFLAIMNDQIGRMQGLVADLLTLSRLEGRPEPAPETPVALDALIANLSNQFSGTAAHQDIALILPDSATLAGYHWYGEADSLNQALGNLVDNALKYSPAGGTVEIQVEPRAGELAVHVQDSGIGIEPQHLPRLTERFYRVDKGRSREVGGTGLGLSIVKHILQHHGGHLEVSSRPGRGSRFSAVLPDHPAGEREKPLSGGVHKAL